MASTPAPTQSVERTTRRLDLGVLAAATLLLRLPAFFAERHLTFDDGVFGASAVAMREGGQPFREVFSSQGPLFLPLVWVADVVGLRQLNSPRLLSVAAGVALVVLVYLAGRTVADRLGALLAAGLTSACASVLWVTGPLAADGVALSFATLAMLLLLRWRLDLTVTRAVWIGLGLGAAISVKSLVGIVLLPVALALLAGRRLWPIVAGAGASMALHFALWLPWGVSDVWDQAYAYHLDVAGERTPGANLAKMLSTLGDRDLPLVAAVVVAVGAAALAAVSARRSPTGTATAADRPELATPAGQNRYARVAGWCQHPDVLLGIWLGATVVMLLTEHPMWRPHVAHLVPPVALLLARHRPPTRALMAVLALALPYHLVHAWEVLHPAPYRGTEADIVATLQVLPDGALAISDDPGIVWRAGRRTTDDLVDTSILRIQTDRVDVDTVVDAAATPQVCAVIVRSQVRWGSFPDLRTRLERAGYSLTRPDTGGRGSYLKSSCSP